MIYVIIHVGKNIQREREGEVLKKLCVSNIQRLSNKSRVESHFID